MNKERINMEYVAEYDLLAIISPSVAFYGYSLLDTYARKLFKRKGN